MIYSSEVQEKLYLIKGYFLVQELVSKRVYDLHGDMSIALIPLVELVTLIQLKDHFQRTIYLNTWYWDKNGYDGKAYRDLKEETGSKGSQHRIAKGFDPKIVGLTAQEVRDDIVQHQHKFPNIRRLEGGVGWVHYDSKNTGKNEIVIFYSKVAK